MIAITMRILIFVAAIAVVVVEDDKGGGEMVGVHVAAIAKNAICPVDGHEVDGKEEGSHGFAGDPPRKNYLEEHITHEHEGFVQGLGQGRPGSA